MYQYDPDSMGAVMALEDIYRASEQDRARFREIDIWRSGGQDQHLYDLNQQHYLSTLHLKILDTPYLPPMKLRPITEEVRKKVSRWDMEWFLREHRRERNKGEKELQERKAALRAAYRTLGAAKH